MFQNYKLGFDVGALILSGILILPTLIQNVLFGGGGFSQTATPELDTVAWIMLGLTVVTLCLASNRRHKKLSRKNFLTLAVALCCVVYYGFWAALYLLPFSGTGMVLGLCLLPCAALLLYCLERKNWPAVVPATIYLLTHLISSLVNVII